MIQNILSHKVIEEFKGAEEMEKYKEKVQEYTNYEIGRKIPETVACYTED